MRRFCLLAGFLFLTIPMVSANSKRSVTFEDISAGLLEPAKLFELRSMKDGNFYTRLKDEAVVKCRYSDGGVVDTIFTTAGRAAFPTVKNYEFNESENVLLLVTGKEPIYRRSFLAEYWVYDLETKSLFPLSTQGKQQVATVSPDGKKAAFVRDNNLFIVDIASGREKQITTDGERGKIINGHTDWVYEEEYAFIQAYQWSPESDAIAFYRFDESDVLSYSMNIFNGQLYPVCYTFKYPKAGERNSIVQIKVYNLVSEKITDMDIGSETDQYIPHIEWTSRPGELAIHRLNRRQNDHEMLFGNVKDGSTRTVYRETDAKYIELIDEEKVTFLLDGKRMVIRNENSGWRHLYLYDMDGNLLNAITNGEWEVTELNRIDSESSTVYFTATGESPLNRNLYSIKLNGKDMKLLHSGGYCEASFSSGAEYCVLTRSSADAPPLTAVYDGKDRQVRVVEDNAKLAEQAEKLQMPITEHFTFMNSSGELLYGFMMKPADFDTSKKYPLFMTQYSGPGSQRVADKWQFTWETALVSEGYIVACVDGRGTGFRGGEFRKKTYRNLGGPETEDQIDAARYLGSLSYIDGQRIGIYGWSYGGFMALNCILKGADVFKLAIAVAPVTSWRFYDTIYTEMYNGLPQENPEGYDNNSPVNFAAQLRGKLFIAHGTADDNVHIQNTYEMVRELTNAGKEFNLMVYPDQNHRIAKSYDDLINRCIRFVKENL